MGLGSCCAILVPLILLVLLVVIEIIRARRLAQEEQMRAEQSQPSAPVVDVLSFGVKNWKTVQDMIRWKGEVSNIDSLMADLAPTPPPPSSSSGV